MVPKSKVEVDSMTKTLLFETGPIISLITNNQLWLLEPLEKQFKGDYYITEAIKKGYTQFVCVGGDGTIHHMINGIMKQSTVKSNKIKLAVIPTGTGNDWVKNYGIPLNFEKAVQLIQNNNYVYQDIGRVKLLKNNKQIFHVLGNFQQG